MNVNIWKDGVSIAQTNVNILADLDENQSGKNEVKYSLSLYIFFTPYSHSTRLIKTNSKNVRETHQHI